MPTPPRFHNRDIKEKNGPFSGIRLLLVLCVFFVPANSIAWHADDTPPQQKSDNVLTLGKVSTNPAKHRQRLQPMVNYLAGKLTSFGITKGRVKVVENAEEMVAMLRNGEVDLVTDTPFSAIRYIKEANALPLARKWKKGVPDYHSIIFVRKENGINNLDDLRGKIIAFEDSDSTTAYMLPLALLLKHGYPIIKLRSLDEPFPSNMIGIVFSGSEQRTSKWVAIGKVDAGAVSNLDWQKPDHLPYTDKKNYQIIYRSRPIPRALELAGPHLDPKLSLAIKQLLIKAHEDPAADYALAKYQKTKRFDEIDQKLKAELNALTKLADLIAPY